MTRIAFIVGTALAFVSTQAVANPGDYRADYQKKVSEMIADCDKKLYEAKDRLEFRKHTAECNRALDKLESERRYEAAKERIETEKRWREREGSDHANLDWRD